MKRPVLWMSLLGLLCGSLAFGQGKAPAGLVEVIVDEFDAIDVSGSLYYSPTSRTYKTAQHIFDAIDDDLAIVHAALTLDDSGWDYLAPTSSSLQPAFNWLDSNYGIVRTNWLFLNPTNLLFGVVGETTAKETFDWLDSWFSTNLTTNGTWTGMMPGTNIAGFSFTNRTWYPPPPPYTNIYLRVGTNQGLTVVSNIAYLDYVLGDTPGTVPATGTLLLDLKLGSAYALPSNGLAASQFDAPGYGVLADWIGVTTASARTNGIVQRSATGFTVESNGTYYASCDFYYAYPGPVHPVGARLVYVTNGVSTTLQESIGNTGSKTFNLASTSFVAGATGVVRVEFSTPDGGQLFFSSFKFGVVE